MKILKTISTYEELNVDLLNQLEIGVEIQDFTEPNLSKKEKKKILNFYKEELKKVQGIKAMHGPFIDLKPSSPDILIYEASYKRYYDAIKIGEILELDYIIFHSQINPNHVNEVIYNIENKQNKDFWHKILKEFPNLKATILIENVFEKSHVLLKSLVEYIDHPKVKVNLDIGHAKIGGQPLERWIKELKGSIAYLHIHSNNGKEDEHLPLKDEEIRKLIFLLDKYNIKAPLALEYNVKNLKSEIDRYRFI